LTPIIKVLLKKLEIIIVDVEGKRRLSEKSLWICGKNFLDKCLSIIQKKSSGPAKARIEGDQKSYGSTSFLWMQMI